MEAYHIQKKPAHDCLLRLADGSYQIIRVTAVQQLTGAVVQLSPSNAVGLHILYDLGAKKVGGVVNVWELDGTLEHNPQGLKQRETVD